MSQIIERIKAKHTVLIGLIVVFIAITVPAVLLVDDFVHDVIMVPIAYYLWLGSIIIKALPQNCFVTSLIILCLAIAIPSLRKSRHTIWSAQMPSETVDGQVALWEQRLRYLAAGSYSDNRFAYHIGHLVVQILAYEERLTTRTVISSLEAGEFNMSLDVRQYVLAGIGSGIKQEKRTLWHRVILWWQQVTKPKQSLHTLKQYKDISAVLLYIEEQLKISAIQNPVHSSAPEPSQPEVKYVK